MKRLKGFTLQEVAVVLAIIAILLAIAAPNYIAMRKRAEVDSVANQFAAMIRELYEKVDSEMEYDTYNSTIGGHVSKYYIKVDNYQVADPVTGEKSLKIWLIKYDNTSSPAREVVLKEIKSKIVQISNTSTIIMNNTGIYTYITFTPNGAIKRFTGSVATRGNVQTYTGQNKLEIEPVSGSGYKKVILLDSVPPGSVELQ